MKSKKFLLLIALVIVLQTVLAACSSNSGGSEGGKDKNANSGGGDGKVNGNYVMAYGGAAEPGEAIPGITDAFNKANPDIQSNRTSTKLGRCIFEIPGVHYVGHRSGPALYDPGLYDTDQGIGRSSTGG